MNSNNVEGKWKLLKGSIQKQWGNLTDNEKQQIQGDMIKLSGRIQLRYGKSQDKAQHGVNHHCQSYVI